MSAEQYFYEDFLPGRRFPGGVHAIDEEAIALFARMTGDAHPLHYDAEYAKRTPFGKPLAHGLLRETVDAE